jgi:hypothetical protein
MNVTLERNSGEGQDVRPYNLNVEITSITVDLETTYRIPVYLHRANGSAPHYSIEICGFRIDSPSAEEMIPLAERLLAGLVNMSRFPTYIFIARRSHQMYPVYTIGDEVFATTPGGPVFRHVELAKVRDYLTDYLHAVGELGVPGKSEKLHVRGINRTTLGLIRPLFYLKKRAAAADEHEFWAPVFMADDGYSIYTYAASGKREVDVAGGYEVLLLRSQVAQALIADHRLTDNFRLRVDRLLPEYWQQMEGTLKKQPQKLVCDDRELPLYRNGGRYLIALDYRRREDRYSFFLGQSADEIRQHVAQDFIRRGLISNPEAVCLLPA